MKSTALTAADEEKNGFVAFTMSAKLEEAIEKLTHPELESAASPSPSACTFTPPSKVSEMDSNDSLILPLCLLPWSDTVVEETEGIWVGEAGCVIGAEDMKDGITEGLSPVVGLCDACLIPEACLSFIDEMLEILMPSVSKWKKSKHLDLKIDEKLSIPLLPALPEVLKVDSVDARAMKKVCKKSDMYRKRPLSTTDGFRQTLISQFFALDDVKIMPEMESKRMK